jgi:hypothetical protein
MNANERIRTCLPGLSFLVLENPHGPGFILCTVDKLGYQILLFHHDASSPGVLFTGWPRED